MPFNMPFKMNFNLQKLDFNNIHEWPLPMRAIVIGFIFAVILYFAYFFDFSSIKKQIVAQNKEEVDLKDQIAALNKKEIARNNDIAHFNEFKNAIKYWQDKLINPAQLPEILNDI